MNHNLQALITGSGKRLGFAMAHELASKGYSLVLHYHQSANETVCLQNNLKELYPSQMFAVCQFNLFDWQNVHRIWDSIPHEFNQISVLVNNSSIYKPSTILNSESSQLIDNFALHLFSPFQLIKSFAQRFSNGVIINMVDTAIASNKSTHAAYLLSKKSLADLTRMAALELAPNIRVNGISPGPVLSAESDHLNKFYEVVSQTPLKKNVSIDGILQAMMFLINNHDVTGLIINVDSGSHLAMK